MDTVKNSFGRRCRCLGIDFSGNFRMWFRGCGSSNVWIAEVVCENSGMALVDLRRVQQLAGDEPPFRRLVRRLRASDYDAAAIDAPFSIPADQLSPRTHPELLQLIAGGRSLDGERKPFLSAREFMNRILDGKPPSIKKPLRHTEEYWRRRGVNVRSTLWAGPRGGAAMTAACLQLLFEAARPIWPWGREVPGLLIEAFPAAQLRHWNLKYQGYNGSNDAEISTRRSVVSSLARRIDFGNFRVTVEMSSDALDSVICAFAAVAVISNRVLNYAEHSCDSEGLIAIYRD